jgi:hypothetical protein
MSWGCLVDKAWANVDKVSFRVVLSTKIHAPHNPYPPRYHYGNTLVSRNFLHLFTV